MQFMAITTGNIGEDGDDVFFLRRFIDDHLFFQRVQLTGQQRIGDVYRLRAADVVHRPLDNVLTVIGNVYHAAVRQYGANAFDRRRLHVRTLHAQLRQQLLDRRAIGMRRTG